MRKTGRFLVAIVFFASLTTLQAQPFQRKTEATPSQPISGLTQSLWNAYERAIYDSSVYQRWNLRLLRPLTPDAAGQVLVATATSREGNVGETIVVPAQGIWVTGVPEVQTICRNFHGDVTMQVRQLLGLPPDADAPRVLTFKVNLSDLFRPSPDDSVTTTYPCQYPAGNPPPLDCGNVFPSTTTPAHYQWIATQSFLLHAVPNGYPWTHLGYTYNWAPGADRYGASEYVIRGGTNALIVQVATTVQYCAPPTQ